MILTEQQEKQLLKEIVLKGRVNIKNIGTLIIKDTRKGNINGVFGGKKPKYKKRVSFKSSRFLVFKINELYGNTKS